MASAATTRAPDSGAVIVQSLVDADAARCLAWLFAHEDAWGSDDDEDTPQPTRGGPVLATP